VDSSGRSIPGMKSDGQISRTFRGVRSEKGGEMWEEKTWTHGAYDLNTLSAF